jgi:two-component system, NtrC family, response regulator AtoC
MVKILVVDDDTSLRLTIEKFLNENGFQTYGASNGLEAKNILESSSVDIVVTDLKMPQMDGMELLRFIKTYFPEIEVILITAYGTVQTAVEAMKLGAFDYITKPVNLDELLIIINKVVEKINLLNKTHSLEIELNRKTLPSKLVYKSKSMKRVIALAGTAAQSDVNVLIEGESGTGKELIARFIHNKSQRKQKPFIPIDCGAIPDNLLESELFGFVKGAFTGAIFNRKGLFEEANYGTIFLDEVSNTSPSLQAKILRAIQEKQIRRLGTNSLIDIDVRIISATNKNLPQLVKEGKFREDLYFRLNVFNIFIPPLRERLEDIMPIANFYLEYYAKKFGKNVNLFAEEVENVFLMYQWPGNVRELQNVVERAVLLSKDKVVTKECIPISIYPAEENDRVILNGLNSSYTLEELEKKYILTVLGKFKGDKSKSAKFLKIGRNTLWRKLIKYGVEK